MEKGRRKLRICILSIVLAAVVTGMVYYYTSEGRMNTGAEDTLVKAAQEVCHVC